MLDLGPWDDLLDVVAELVGHVRRGGWKLQLRLTGSTPPAAVVAAEACRLTHLSGPTWLDRTTAPLRARFETWYPAEEEKGAVGTRLLVDAPDRWIVPIGLRPESRETERAKERGAREIETGDDPFDDAFYVTGPEPSIRAVLDAPTRRMLLDLWVQGRFTVSSGELRAELRHTGTSPDLDGLLLSRALGLMLAAARRLRRPEDVVARLAANAATDPVAAVRRENLLCLLRQHPDAEPTRAAIRAAAEDGSPDVRLRAASALGDEGRPILLALARQREGGEDLPSARAITRLGTNLGTDELVELLGYALRARRAETAHACLSGLGGRRDPGAVPAMAKVLAVDRGGHAAAAAEALALTGLPQAEAPLLGALSHSASDVRLAAVTGLAQLGSVAAVLPLKEIEAGDPDAPLRRAARQAIAAIQARIPGASPGQLSLAAPDSGALSLAEDERGRLSVEGSRKD